MSLIRNAENGEGTEPNTDWPILRSFPVFLLNCLEFLGGAVNTSGSKSIQPGETAVLPLASRFDKVKVVGPENMTREVDRSGAPQLIFNQNENFAFIESSNGWRQDAAVIHSKPLQ